MLRIRLIVFLLGISAFFVVRHLNEAEDANAVDPAEPVTFPHRTPESDPTPIWDRSGQVQLCQTFRNPATAETTNWMRRG